jgi:hypothetical protein
VTRSEPFSSSRTCFEELIGWLEGTEAAALDHAELEDELEGRGRELLRRLLQGQLDLRALREQRTEVLDHDGICHGAVESRHVRPLASVFGAVEVSRLAYRHRGHANLYPADSALNLPEERHSHGLRRLAAVESARGSFQEASSAIARATGQSLGKRQVESLAFRSAVDVEDVYATRRRDERQGGELVVISADGKGIVMRPESLREATAKKAEAATNKLSTRLSKGEKRNRKRLAEVGAVYDLEPFPRTAPEVLASSDDVAKLPAPKAANKWLTASVVDDAASVLARVFDEACQRDPDHERVWVVLVDGNNHQIARAEAEATARSVEVTILVDR